MQLSSGLSTRCFPCVLTKCAAAAAHLPPGLTRRITIEYTDVCYADGEDLGDRSTNDRFLKLPMRPKVASKESSHSMQSSLINKWELNVDVQSHNRSRAPSHLTLITKSFSSSGPDNGNS